jgi:hypothetical protein
VEHATTIISHERLYEQLGHPHRAVVTETAKKYSWIIKPPILMQPVLVVLKEKRKERR